jgi:hypothetical protein
VKVDLEALLAEYSLHPNLLEIDHTFWGSAFHIFGLTLVVLEDLVSEHEVSLLPSLEHRWLLLFHDAFRKVIGGES